MKTLSKIYLIAITLLFLHPTLKAQQGASEYESKRVSGTLANPSALSLANILNAKSSDDQIFQQLKTVLDGANGDLTAIGTRPDFTTIRTEVLSALKAVEANDNAAVIAVYRKYPVTTAGGISRFDVDFKQTNNIVFHNRSQTGSFSNYLLATKTVYLILIDVDEKYYTDDPDNKDYRLNKVTTKINYRTNQFNQSFKDLVAVAKAAGAPKSVTLELTLIKIDPSRVKDPCDIVVGHPKFEKDLTYTIHERNIATFQVGVTSSKLALNNVSISGGNLTIKPSADQTKDWKSNAYALLEVHLPRDVDNFRPILSSILSSPDKKNRRSPGRWLMDNTISRIGVYGGVKIGKDPLSSLYAGFNYALSKELAVNFGWSWINNYVNQVTDVGAITSLNDALAYARRRYSAGQFSIGISFAPSYFTTIIGAKSKSADSGN